MDQTSKTFDAVRMVREIRDRHHEQFKDKPIEERIAYYRKKAQDFQERGRERRTEDTAS